eukprot:TRINITY_DN975_c0_g1_i3.p1 TRINITY_DN975_c0_g1~~TRINITY_DN975_c0_g1_i3.p1  ORF type:complete len:573 (-),score=205.37 TRINITY_DN975_c0_g1_i3:938-2656(-)
MKFIGSATEFLEELTGLFPEDLDDELPIKKLVTQPKPQPKAKVPVVRKPKIITKPFPRPTPKPTVTPNTSTSSTSTQTESEPAQPEPELEFTIPFQNCPGCSANIPLVGKQKCLKFKDLYPQLQLTCKPCSLEFCSLCSSEHEAAPCYASCCYIVHRIIRHLTRLILSYKTAKTTSNYNNYMPKGTGYGTGSSAAVNQAEIKKKARQVDAHVAALLRTFKEAISLARGEEQAKEKEDETHEAYEIPSMFEILQSSKFLPILFYFLRNDSFFDMNERLPLYNSLFALIEKLAEDEQVKNELLKGARAGERDSVASLIAKMNAKAKLVSSPALQSGESRVSTLTSAVKKLHTMFETITIKAEPQSDNLVVIEKEEETTSIAIPTGGALENTPHFFSFTEFKNPQKENPQPQIPTKTYVETMQDHQFGELTLVTTPPHPYRHYHLAQITSTKNQLLPEGIQRVCLELQSLCSQDFISEAGKNSILVRFDPENLSALRVLITGPPDTPYAYGCFIFDIFLPPNYPKVPPQVQLVTTGYGAVRFNPNLYNSGEHTTLLQLHRVQKPSKRKPSTPNPN